MAAKKAVPTPPPTTPSAGTGLPGVIPATPKYAMDFSWAVNRVKLNRAIAHVQETQPGLKDKEFESAVKARYTEIKGLLANEKPVKATRGTVQNLADDDGSED